MCSIKYISTYVLRIHFVFCICTKRRSVIKFANIAVQILRNDFIPNEKSVRQFPNTQKQIAPSFMEKIHDFFSFLTTLDISHFPVKSTKKVKVMCNHFLYFQTIFVKSLKRYLKKVMNFHNKGALFIVKEHSARTCDLRLWCTCFLRAIKINIVIVFNKMYFSFLNAYKG